MPPSDSSEAPDQSVLPEGQTSVSQPEAEDEDRAILAQLTIGSVVDGKYKVDKVLGRGAMGVVLQATHVHLGEKVALKFLRYRAKAGTEDFQSRFKREARVSAKLKNEHITRVIDVGVWKERVPYMVMDYLEGGDLRELIKAQGPLPIGTAIDYTVQVCVGIAEAHANGIVHRDLKPSNLFLTKRSDGSDLLKVLDFGISKWRAGESEVDELTQTGVVLGSPKYMAPEQLFGSADVDSRADVWSIGAILYELLAGRPPFDLPTFTRICAELSTNRPPPSLVEKRPDVTPELEAVVMKCFMRNPDERTRDVAELAGSLLDAVQAPFAAPMRQKIASMLDPGNTNPLGSSGTMGGMPSGAYGTMSSGSYATMSTTGSGPRSTTSESGRTPAPTSTMGASTTASAQTMEPAPARRGALIPGLAVGALLVVGIAAYVSMSGHDTPKGQPASAAAAPTAPPTSTFAVATPTASGTASATAPTPSATASSGSTVAAAPQPPAPPPPPGRNYWRPRPAPPPPPANTVAQQAPTAAPAPTPAAPPAPTSKVDPLGDRQ